MDNTVKILCKKITWAFIGLGILFVISVLGLVAFGYQMKNLGEMSQLKSTVAVQEQKNKNLNNESNSASQIAATNMKRGDQGPPGIQGPPGPTGGVHAGAGQLLCVGKKKVATPTVGKSDASIIYLDDRRYTPIQYWTMRNNPDGSVSIVNKFTGNCMTTNNNYDVYSDTCKPSVPLNQKFNWGPNMQLSSASTQGFCVSAEDKFEMNKINSNNKYDLENLTVKDNSNNGEVIQLKLKACSLSQNLDQTWWIGN